jgi:ribose-phosphate pyrophosphokinase
MVDSASTVHVLSRRFKAAGANRILICASHGLFTENALNMINESPVDQVIVTDSLPLPDKASHKIHQVSIAKYLATIVLTEHFRSQIYAEEEFEQE